MMNKLFRQSAAYSQPKERGNLIDLPCTRVWWDEPTSDSRRPQDFAARVGWLLGAGRYVALAAFIVACGGAVRATHQRRMNH